MSDRLDEGQGTHVTFADYPSIKLWEKEITPPGIDNGEPVETTVMANSVWETQAPRQLNKMDDISYKAAYASSVYSDLVSACGKNNILTVHFRDGSTLAVWGYLRSFKPDPIKKGEQSTAMVTIVLTMQDNSGVETAPVYTPPP